MTTTSVNSRTRAGDALIVTDVQNDFLPGGNLAIPRGDEIIPAINRYIALFQSRGLPVFAVRDWHPEGHCSFKSQGGPWPTHCIAGTRGAEFAPGLKLPGQIPVISKATMIDKEAYSGFEGTDLILRLRQIGVTRVFVCGLATDYCVLNTARDALAAGFQVIVLRDACRAVNVQPGDGAQAESEMERLGAVLLDDAALSTD